MKIGKDWPQNWQIEASAPGRCGLVGNPSDMYSGTVISCSIQERAYCRVSPSDSGFTSITIGEESQVVRSQQDLELDGSGLDIVKAALSDWHTAFSTNPITITVSSDIPRQSGLAGSTAIMASLCGALYFGASHVNPYQAAELVRTCEFSKMKTLCGFQDAYMTAFGGLQYMDFAGKSVALNDPNSSPFATMEPLSERMIDAPRLLVAFSGQMHHSGQTHASLYQRYVDGDQTAKQVAEQFANLARAAKRSLIQPNWTHLAELMTENQRLIRSVQPQNPANETLIQSALDSGAMAAKLAGAGGGGSIIALVDRDEDLAKVASALEKLGAAAILYPKPSAGLTVTTSRN